MLSVDEALQAVLTRSRTKAPVVRPLADALGLVLAEDVASDVDSPPHDKSVVDGYAVVAADLAGGLAELDVLEEVTAGAVPTRTVSTGKSTRIMTGAPLPEGADAVVMIEQSQPLDPGEPLSRVRIDSPKVVAGQNIMRRAVSMARGDLVLRAGRVLRAIDVGVLAEVGRTRVKVVERPTVAVMATGNELVPSDRIPAAGQIRNSNSPLLLAAASAAGADAVDLGIARDERNALGEAIGRGLECDVLVISGGVSAGVLDLVPSVLAECGVEQVFHKVNLKPGKPLWFGVLKSASGERLVFGLPGNPVSSFVCFELFVRPAIGRLAVRTDAGLASISVPLAVDFMQRSDRPTYHPARLAIVEGRAGIEPLRWQGSGDLRTLIEANALAYFPPGQRAFRAGEIVQALRLE